ncbi:MAG: ATP-binding protein [Cyanobacteriota bacterium]|nr:ATP-binding protein [Cyanobacteriota bacterium]
MRWLLEQKLADAMARPLPRLTRRDIWWPLLPGKAVAVLGMRRSGKTSLLWQKVGEGLERGLPRQAMPLLSFDDERLAGSGPELLDQLLELWFAFAPQWRSPGDHPRGCLFLDEIQLIAGWEGFVRRVIDSEPIDLVISGSSAQMLSSEIASSMRGRALACEVLPFSFREALRHGAQEPETGQPISSATRSRLQQALLRYLEVGGFPEVQSVDERLRTALLASYVDSTVLRDVIERHNVSQPVALRALVRQLLGQPAGRFSVQKLHGALRSQGFAISKDTVHALIAHLKAAYLLLTVPIASESIRQRQSNPRKLYPIDPGLIGLFDRRGQRQLGQRLETVVALELLRRGCSLSYGLTSEREEVDFVVRSAAGDVRVVQVCVDLLDADTLQRELRPLPAMASSTGAVLTDLVVLHPPNRPISLPEGVRLIPALDWLLEEG